MNTIISFVYAISGFVVAAMYVPQILSAFRSRGAGISPLAWLGWTLTSLSASLYAGMVVKDTLFLILSCLNTLGCLLVLASRALSIKPNQTTETI